MDSPHIVVLGGGYAGLTAAARLGEAGLSGTELPARVTLIDTKPGFVERIRMHEIAAGATPRDLGYAPFLDARGVGFLQGRAVSLDPDGREIQLRTPDGANQTIAYDWLVYALGSRTDHAGVPGAAEFARTLDTMESAREIFERAGLAAGNGERALVVGGGLTGLECAAELAERIPTLKVTIALGRDYGPNTAPGGLSADGVDHVRRVFERLGVETLEGVRVSRLESSTAHFEDGSALPYGVCVWAAGFRAPPLARSTGLTVDKLDRVVTDETLRSVSHPDILAIGDAARVAATPDRSYRMSCAAGRPMGEAAAAGLARLIAGQQPEPFAFRYSFRCLSLGREDGLIQFVDENDAPVREFWGDGRGATWKEYICRRTIAGIGLEPDLGPPPDQPPETLTRFEAG